MESSFKLKLVSELTQDEELTLGKIANALIENRSYLLVTHINPDGDAVGSLLALQAVLRGMGKAVTSFCESTIPSVFHFLEGAKDILNDVKYAKVPDVVVFLDCGSIERGGRSILSAIDPSSFVINIDHHVQEKPFGEISWVKTLASSTCEMLFDLFLFMGLPITPAVSTCLYTGILTDTGSFQFSNTSQRVLEIAALLTSYGADPHRIAQRIFESSSPQKLLLLGKVLETLRYFRNYTIATARLTKRMLKETGANVHDGEGFVNMLRQVESVKVSVMFREDDNGIIHVGLRSKGAFDVARFARQFGGGGHINASACRIEGSIEAVEDIIISSLITYLDSQEIDKIGRDL
ncbi:MAG: bifunctional oligoribonuclease/PAP phosphatase NrnA [Syntrophobacterales bacterium]|nr:bifunctional oligoribonuclease/PAP phosphatase NrnA [Syntrophobacterales bacterium]